MKVYVTDVAFFGSKQPFKKAKAILADGSEKMLSAPSKDARCTCMG